MTHKRLLGFEYLIRLERGEEFFAELEKFCRRQKIQAGWFWALGAFERATLSYYNLRGKKYSDKKLNRLLEAVSLTGNIATMSGKRIFHAHCVLSAKNLRAYGGHLKKGIVGGTLEVYLKVFGKKISRKHSRGSGLKLLDL